MTLDAGDRDDGVQHSRRAATLDGRQVEIEVLRGTPPPGTKIEAPAVVELPESTLLVPDGWRGEVDRTGTIVIGAQA